MRYDESRARRTTENALRYNGSLMPEKHFHRDLNRLVDFSFVYDKVESLYSNTGCRSVDPVVIVKMMLIGYLYGIDSERRWEQEVQVNIAYRWFLGINLDEPVPDHSTFSQLRHRKFNGTTLFEDVFEQVVRLCIEKVLITGKRFSYRFHTYPC